MPVIVIISAVLAALIVFRTAREVIAWILVLAMLH